VSENVRAIYFAQLRLLSLQNIVASTTAEPASAGVCRFSLTRTEHMSENPFFSAFFDGFRPARQRERAALTIYKALQARQDDFVQPGGGSVEAPARAPRTQRRTSARKPASGDDGDGDGPARRRVQPLLYDLADVADALSISTRGVQRLVQEGSFPKPRAVSARRVAWRVSDVEAWVGALPVADCLPPPNAGVRNG
jgi:prophage regulatory protein